MPYLLFYDVNGYYAERRGPFRSAHIAYARQAVAQRRTRAGLRLADPADGAVLLFRGASAAVAASFPPRTPSS